MTNGWHPSNKLQSKPNTCVRIGAKSDDMKDGLI